MKNLYCFLVLILSLPILYLSCSDQKIENEYSAGMMTAVTDISGAEVYDAIISALEENEDIKIISEVDHSEDANAEEMTLPYTRVIIFGNPRLGTFLMQENIVTGLDLPQKILVTENVDGSVDISYNGIEYLKHRHDLNESESLEKIENALSTLISSVASDTPILREKNNASYNEGIIIKESESEFNKTYIDIKERILNTSTLNIIAEINHSENAASVNLDLPKSKLIIFGNPIVGTPLIKKSQYMGIDLPLKILVFEEDNKVKIAYNEIQYLLNRHNIYGVSEISNKISKTLKDFVEQTD